MRRHAKAIVAISALLLLSLVMGVMSATAAAPVVSIDAASSVSYTSAHVSGRVDPQDAETFYYFEYAKDLESEGWTQGSFQGPLAAGSGETSVADDLGGLEPGATYQVRLVATNFSEESTSAEPNPTFTTDPVAAPTVTLGAPSSIGSTSAHFTGTIDPGAPVSNPPAFDVSWHFQCVPSCPGLSGSLPAAGAPQEVSADATGLKPGTAYKVSLIASNAGGEASAGPGSFSTSVSAPKAIGIEVQSRRTEATFSAQVNPGGLATTYQIEYGATTAYGQKTTPGTVAAGGDVVTVKSTAFGLDPGSTYHYRIVLSNASGVESGADGSFDTAGVPVAADACANAGIRATQRATFLPACRAYEQVSPVDKGGTDAIANRYAWRSSPSGDAVAYVANGAFGDATASIYNNWYVASRDPQRGWQSISADIAQQNRGVVQFDINMSVSEDLSHSYAASNLALTPDAVAGNNNFYLRDNATKELQLVYSAAPEGAIQRWEGVGSTDYSHMIFGWGEGLIPEATASTNLYEFTEGRLRLVNYLPDGRLAAGALPLEGPNDLRNSISRDGSRIFFEATALEPGLYVRENGTTTVPISVSRRSGEEGQVKPARFLDASADGSVVFFQTAGEAPLLDDSDPAGLNVYRYDLNTKELTDVSADGSGGSSVSMNLPGMAAASQDGNYFYFIDKGALAPGANSGSPNFYVWHAGALRLIASWAPGAPYTQYNFTVSDNGKFASLSTYKALTGEYEDVDNPRCGAGIYNEKPEGTCARLYAYQFDADDLSCVSCPLDGGPARGDVSTGPYAPNWNGEASSIGDDGSFFFDTPERLDPNDQNGVRDVYEWRDGAAHLISAGSGSQPSMLMDVSGSGNDVFFATVDRLVSQDTDLAYDAYDARRLGGIAAQNPPLPQALCAGEECQSEQGMAGARARPATTHGTQKAGSARRSCLGLSGRADRAKRLSRKLVRRARSVNGPDRRRLVERGRKKANEAARLRRLAKACVEVSK